MQPYQVRIRRPPWIEPSQYRPLGRAKPVSMTFEYFQSQAFEFVVAGRTELRGNCHTVAPVTHPGHVAKTRQFTLSQTGRNLRIARTREFLLSCCHVRFRALSLEGTNENPHDNHQQSYETRHDRLGNRPYLYRSDARTASLGSRPDRGVGRVPCALPCLKLCLGGQDRKRRLGRSEGDPPERRAGGAVQVTGNRLDQGFRQGERQSRSSRARIRRKLAGLAQEVAQPGTHLRRA
jgi:hypothetical protein